MPAADPTTLAQEGLEEERTASQSRASTPQQIRGSRRRRLVGGRTTVAVAGVVLLAAIAVFVVGQKALRLESAVSADLTRGQSQLEAGKAALKASSQNHQPADVSHAQADFAAARQSFADAQATVNASSLVRWGLRIPLLNRYLNPRVIAIDDLAAMGINLADAANVIAGVDLKLISPNQSGSAGGRLLATVRGSSTDIASIKSKLQFAEGDIRAVDGSVLSTSQRQTLTKAKATIATALNGITEFQRLTPALIEILGGNGRRTYLIEQVNPSELRSGGGFIGTESVVSVDNGTFKLVSSGDSYSFDGYLPDERPRAWSPYYVRPPGTLTGFYGGYSWSFEDTNFFPDFTTNAKWAESFANLRQGLKLDGVIAMDYYTVADMLKVTGPINIPGYGVTFDSNNLVHQVFTRDLNNDPTHKSILAAAAGPLVERISSLPADRWPQLPQVLNGAVSQRHLQLHFNNDVAQTEMTRLGWAGTLNPLQASDFFMETEDNFGANKANYFVTRKYTVTLTRNGALVHHHVVVDVNDPPGGPPGYNHGYNGYVRFYTPKDATGQHLASGTPEYRSEIPPIYPNNDPPTGYKLTDAWMYITQNGHESGHFQLVFDYDTPWADTAGAHVIYWQKQPGTGNDAITVIWQTGGQSFKVTGALSQDREIVLTPTGVKLQAAQQSAVSLPSLSF